MNILIVDDDEELNEEFISSATLFGHVACSAENVNVGLQKLKSEQIDFAVVDLDFGDGQPTGETLVHQLNSLCVRVPVVIHTGNPSSADSIKDIVLGIFKRGCEYKEIFDCLEDVQRTGINDILGKKGFFEKQLQNYYKDFFLKKRQDWINRAKVNADRVKQSLLRNLIYRMEIESNCAPYYDEFYLPAVNKILHTGSIVKNKETQEFFLIITPACDIEYRACKENEGTVNEKVVMKPKVKMISLCKIESVEEFGFSKTGEGAAIGKSVSPLFQNSNDDKELMRYHWLPPIDEFNGGFLNFTDVKSCNFNCFFEYFELTLVRVSSPYLKNIMARFSSYFARQGQPDLDTEAFRNELKWLKKEKNAQKLLRP